MSDASTSKPTSRQPATHARVARAALTGMLSIAVLWLGVVLAGCDPATSEGEVQRPTSEATPETGPGTAAVPAGEPGVSDDRILFGQSAAFRGPAQELGLNMRLGILAAFHEANQQGGVHGRQIDLTWLDDSYEPEAAATNTLELINEQNVFALIGAVGTPTSRSATPVANAAGVPYIGPFTGAEFLRDAATLDNVINMRASYYQETEEMVNRLTTDLGVTRIAVLYQDDSYGLAGFNGVRLALERRNMEMAALGIYTRNTTAVKRALLDLRQGNPEAVIIIGAYQPVAAMIAWGRQTGFDPIFMTVSFVGSNALAEELGAGGAGVFVTQVVPFPTDDSLPVVRAYHRALAAYDPEAIPGFVSFEGYLAGRLAVAGLERCGRDVSRACLFESFRSTEPYDIEGFRLSYGAGDNQGSDQVFLTVLGPDANYHPAETLRDVPR